MSRRLGLRGRLRDQQSSLFDEPDDLRQTLLNLEISHYKWAFSSHLLRVCRHHLERSANMRSQVDLVDDEQVGPSDPWSSFSRDFFAASNIDHIDREIGKLRTECRREIIASGFEKTEPPIGKALQPRVVSFEFDCPFFRNARVRPPAVSPPKNSVGQKSP